MNAMSNVIVRLSDSLFRESKRNPANRIRTINGLKI
jgi:hypothetical protein